MPHMDKNRLFPALWEDFFERFLNGEAEVNSKYDSSGYSANVYELIFSDESHFPCFIGNKIITRDLLINEVNRRLAMTTNDNYKNKINHLQNAATDNAKKEKLQEYFGKTIKALEELWGKL